METRNVNTKNDDDDDRRMKIEKDSHYTHMLTMHTKRTTSAISFAQGKLFALTWNLQQLAQRGEPYNISFS